jgi:hypothetical protein
MSLQDTNTVCLYRTLTSCVSARRWQWETWQVGVAKKTAKPAGFWFGRCQIRVSAKTSYPDFKIWHFFPLPRPNTKTLAPLSYNSFLPNPSRFTVHQPTYCRRKSLRHKLHRNQTVHIWSLFTPLSFLVSFFHLPVIKQTTEHTFSGHSRPQFFLISGNNQCYYIKPKKEITLTHTNKETNTQASYVSLKTNPFFQFSRNAPSFLVNKLFYVILVLSTRNKKQLPTTATSFNSISIYYVSLFNPSSIKTALRGLFTGCLYVAASGGAVGWGTAPQNRRSWIRFPTGWVTGNFRVT